MQRATELTNDKDWKRVPDIEHRVRQFLVGRLLEEGKVEKAIPFIKELLKADSKGAQDLVAQAVAQMADRIERLTYDPAPQAKAKLKALRGS